MCPRLEECRYHRNQASSTMTKCGKNASETPNLIAREQTKHQHVYKCCINSIKSGLLATTGYDKGNPKIRNPETANRKLQLAGHSYSTRSMEYAFKQQLATRDYYNSSKNNFRMEQTPRGNHIVQFTGCF